MEAKGRNEHNFVQLNKYYSLYNNMVGRQLENSIVRNMIFWKKKFDNIQNKILEDLFNRLLNRKKRVTEEDTKLREKMIYKLCEVNSKEDLDRILKGIEPLLRNKRRTILLMGGSYEDLRKETKQAIVKHMPLVPTIEKESEKCKPESPVNVKVSTPSSDEEEVEETHQVPSPPHIVMGIESMEVDNTYITMDTNENPFVGYGSSIVGNIITYSRFDDEEEEEEKKK